MIQISTEGGRIAFEPGESIRGRVEWFSEGAPSDGIDALEVRLLWYTEGRGDQDVGLANSRRIERLPGVGAQDFEFELPSGPYSCSGRLISIVWAIEASIFPERAVSRLEFILAPAGREVVFAGSADSQRSPKLLR
jgi:hypothetical protein